ncbi:MAG: phospholipase A [Rhizobacter sp.]|nr:phospholipase A [Rhizobacter sp.]
MNKDFTNPGQVGSGVRRLWPLWAASFGSTAVLAAPIDQCVAIDDDAQRLVCYDRAAGRPLALPLPAASGPDIDRAERSGSPALPKVDAAGESSIRPLLSTVWELDAVDKRGTFNMLPHRLTYMLPVRYTTRVNALPSSPTPGHSVDNALPIDSTEAKFQFSFKFKAWQNMLGDNGDLWFGYTQQSHWQMYSGAVSSPFRETNYEPELIVSLRTEAELLGWRWRALNLGLVHQSNGRPLPLSRSWNRVYAQFGIERGNFTVLARPWLRFREKAESDDNPDIGSYYGSGDLRLAYAHNGHLFSALGRYSLSGKRGGLQLDWAYPISGSMKGYLQFTSGYGESLVDYNHAQNTIGLGVLFVPWQ